MHSRGKLRILLSLSVDRPADEEGERACLSPIPTGKRMMEAVVVIFFQGNLAWLAAQVVDDNRPPVLMHDRHNWVGEHRAKTRTDRCCFAVKAACPFSSPLPLLVREDLAIPSRP